MKNKAFSNVLNRRLFAVKSLSPGETVSLSGVYRVIHIQHREDHEVVAVTGDVLPSCRVCHDQVRFDLVRATEYVSHDWDLAGPINISRAASE